MSQRAIASLPSTATAPLRVFIADDSRIVHRYLALSLAAIPGTALAGRAFNTKDTVSRVRELRPDVLVLDIEMPPDGGLEVLNALRFDDPRPAIYVLTLHASPVLATVCRALGADDFFEKNTDLPALLEVLSRKAVTPDGIRPDPNSEATE